MIIHETLENQNLIKTYSSLGYFIKQDQTGLEFIEAIDIKNTPYTYTETTSYIEDEITTDEALNILLGGESNE